MSWREQTQDIQNKINQLYSSEVQTQIASKSPEYTQNLSTFIKTGGVKDNLAAYGEIQKYLSQIEEIISELTAKVKTVSKNTDLTGKLAEIGRIQQDLLIKKDRLAKAKQEAETSQTRDLLLRSHKTDITRDKIFLLGRPIKKSSIPYLWMSTALFSFLAVTILLVMIPTLSTDPFGLFEYGKKFSNRISTSALGQYAYGPSFYDQLREI
ncbi:MAG: hypothetical protein EBS19_04740, partial [Spirochaetia bacterium]|nr:hypothetical protein [Spirochaetia bacterium]